MSDEAQQASLTWRVTPDMMSILDGDGRFVAVNPAWEATLGWSLSEMVGKSYVEFLHPDDVERSKGAFEDLVRGKPALRFENRYRTAAGDYRWLQWVAVPEGENYYANARDVTDDKLRVDRIAAQQAEAELRDQFIAVLGHDLRNPLAAIGAGAILLEGRVDNEKSLDILRQLKSSVSRMSELINNLMDLARMRLGDGITVARISTSTVAEELEQVISEIRLVSPETSIEHSIHVEGSVTCDPARLAQLVSNLLANAVTHGTSSEPVRLHAETRDGRLKVTVTNKGEPIPSAAMENLFQPFFRGGVRAGKQGLGLGLFIASEIARAHDGTLSASSTEDETRFTLDIPNN